MEKELKVFLFKFEEKVYFIGFVFSDKIITNMLYTTDKNAVKMFKDKIVENDFQLKTNLRKAKVTLKNKAIIDKILAKIEYKQIELDCKVDEMLFKAKYGSKQNY